MVRVRQHGAGLARPQLEPLFHADERRVEVPTLVGGDEGLGGIGGWAEVLLRIWFCTSDARSAVS